jgi:two-component system, NtrC family, response regulator AtoC
MSYSVLIVDDEENARKNIGDFLTSKGYEVIGAAKLEEARKAIEMGAGDVILLDVRLPDGYGPNLLMETANMSVRPPIIIITAYGDIEMAVESMRNGAHDFLTKPVDLGQMERTLQRACEIVAMRRELAHLRQTQTKDLEFVIGNNPNMKVVLEQANRAAVSSVSVLITGETGTGKEVLAKYIHVSGPRVGKPFIALNCAAIQNTVLESELFGYEAGAFTGAERRKPGLMEVADTGILFLDEISSMPLDIQAKLLRAIDEKAFRRVGGTALLKVDVQILAASNRDLKTLMRENQFREDLYYRLKVVDLHLPPLKDRKEDIPELVGFFIRQDNMKLGKNILDITPRALQALKAYSWPGNIRELSNALERACLFCDGASIDLAELPADITRVKK